MENCNNNSIFKTKLNKVIKSAHKIYSNIFSDKSYKKTQNCINSLQKQFQKTNLHCPQETKTIPKNQSTLSSRNKNNSKKNNLHCPQGTKTIQKNQSTLSSRNKNNSKKPIYIVLKEQKQFQKKQSTLSSRNKNNIVSDKHDI